MAIRREFRETAPPDQPPWLYDGLLAKTAAAFDAAVPLGEVLCRHRLHDANAANRELRDNESALGRLRSLRGGRGDEIAAFARSLRRFERATAGLELPERNRDFLSRYARYFRRRVAWRKRRLWRRLWPGCALWKEYFTLGRGVRSYLRDVLMK